MSHLPRRAGSRPPWRARIAARPLGRHARRALVVGSLAVLVACGAAPSAAVPSSSAPPPTNPARTSPTTAPLVAPILGPIETSAPASAPLLVASPALAGESASAPDDIRAGLIYEGVGSQLLDVDLPVPGAPALVSITYSSTQNWRHFSLWAFDDEYRQVGLLVNELGSFSGAALVDLTEGTHVTSFFGVDAAGAWTIRIDPLSSARHVGGEVQGNGPDAFLYTGDTAVVRVASQSDGRFALRSIEGRSSGLLIDQMGAFESEVTLPGHRLVVVQAIGAWSLAPQRPTP